MDHRPPVVVVVVVVTLSINLSIGLGVPLAKMGETPSQRWVGPQV